MTSGREKGNGGQPAAADAARSAAIAEENRRLRALRVLVDGALAILRHHPLSRAEAEALVGRVRAQVLLLFPGKGPVFDLIYASRFHRAIRERFGLQ